MLARLRPRLTFANVVSLLALFVALGGTAAAVSQLPANSVGTKQLKSSAVTRAKVHGNAIASGKVANDSLVGDDIEESSLQMVPYADHANDADNAILASHAGTAGNAQTADNANQLGGTAAASYLRNKAIYTSDTATDTSDVKTTFALCPNGSVPIGGGGAIINLTDANTNKVSTHESYPGQFLVGGVYKPGWRVTAQENTGSGGTGSDDWTLRTIVICADFN
jgi:hypothetical protein